MNETASAASAELSVEQRRYARAAIWLHWALAALLLLQIALGWFMNEALPDHSPSRRAAVHLHISVGLTILLLVAVRIGIRLAHRPPPPPAGMPVWEHWLANLVHFTFYLLMLVIPLSGWLLVSMGDRPISFWGLPWPHLPGVHAAMGNPVPKDTREALSHFHVYVLIWIFFVNLALHVAGALKHQFDGRPVLWRMTWLRPPSPKA